jgi:hypothetical protein
MQGLRLAAGLISCIEHLRPHHLELCLTPMLGYGCDTAHLFVIASGVGGPMQSITPLNASTTVEVNFETESVNIASSHESRQAKSLKHASTGDWLASPIDQPLSRGFVLSI